jgi:hypothetical protein
MDTSTTTEETPEKKQQNDQQDKFYMIIRGEVEVSPSSSSSLDSPASGEIPPGAALPPLTDRPS